MAFKNELPTQRVHRVEHIYFFFLNAYTCGRPANAKPSIRLSKTIKHAHSCFCCGRQAKRKCKKEWERSKTDVLLLLLLLLLWYAIHILTLYAPQYKDKIRENSNWNFRGGHTTVENVYILHTIKNCDEHCQSHDDISILVSFFCFCFFISFHSQIRLKKRLMTLLLSSSMSPKTEEEKKNCSLPLFALVWSLNWGWIAWIHTPMMHIVLNVFKC